VRTAVISQHHAGNTLASLSSAPAIAIDDESHVAMKLQRGGRNGGGERPLRLALAIAAWLWGRRLARQKNSYLDSRMVTDSHGDGALVGIYVFGGARI